MLRRLIIVALCALFVAPAMPVRAGTTGTLRGRAVDVNSNAPIAGVKVTAASPAQSEMVVTDTSGFFSFISLAPDTYTVTGSKDGYEVASLQGVTIISDQSRSVTLNLQPKVRTLATVSARGAASLVRPGTTSDVYSINAASQRAASSLAGSGGLNQAYSSIASAAGVVYPQGQQGWNQSVFIRGGDYDQVAYEVDGIPVTRQSDSAPVATLTSLGNQEVQVYTGGTPASADASGLAGYVNQVIKSGVYPGYGNFIAGMGMPALYNKGIFEYGGATPDRTMSYYIATAVIGQDYRYGDQNNGVSNPLFFYPLYIPSHNGNDAIDANGNSFCAISPCVYDGSGTGAIFGPGNSNAIAHTTDHETLMNFHYRPAHRFDTGKDDLQLLYMYGDILQKFYGSESDLEMLDNGFAQNTFGGAIPYFDGFAYNAPLFAAPDTSKGSIVLFPNSPQHRTGFSDLQPVTQREGSDNGVALTKLQYQRNIDSKTYLRVFGYSRYAYWFISGPLSAQQTFGGQLPDYEVLDHTYGGNITFSRQLSDKHLINLTGSYQTGKLQTYNANFYNFNYFWNAQSNYIDNAGNCYSFTNGLRTSCFNPTDANGNQTTGFITAIVGGQAQGLTPGNAPAGSPAALANAQWIMTENGKNAQVDNVIPYTTGLSATDNWRPDDKLSINAGIRIENYRMKLQDLTAGYPARAFWFHAFDAEFCTEPGVGAIQRTFDRVTGAESPCPAGTTPSTLHNTTGTTESFTVPQPRFAFSYQFSPDTVVRGSYGRYARPPSTSYQEFNTFAQNLPGFIGQFVGFGYDSPVHPVYPDTSNNFDFSLERHVRGTDMAYKITPFLRATQNQLQNIAINGQGVDAGINTGSARSTGLELAFSKGSFDHDGVALQIAATWTHTTVKYGPFPNGKNVIDLLNNPIRDYNALTAAGGGAATYTNCMTCPPVANPYFNAKPQPLFDRNGSYTPYDLIPSPFNGAIGYDVPFTASVVVGFKAQRFTATPTFTFSSGTWYGSPLVWPGYDPRTCTGVTSGMTADTTTCTGFLFIPDKYTGVFDNMGAFREPSRLTANLALGYDISPRVKGTLTLANLVDHCFERGEPWDAPNTCIYAQLASNLLAPAGNFVANPPVQLKYPYGNWYYNQQVGAEGQKIPLQATFEMSFKL
ncbi:MAG TPA: TonB-dependent receptor [Candidatus Eremiobacteraceae bacterium]|nr:TonB-dependent receptor [Candidatus Eremiobacteraceae bacterium]